MSESIKFSSTPIPSFEQTILKHAPKGIEPLGALVDGQSGVMYRYPLPHDSDKYGFMSVSYSHYLMHGSGENSGPIERTLASQKYLTHLYTMATRHHDTPDMKPYDPVVISASVIHGLGNGVLDLAKFIGMSLTISAGLRLNLSDGIHPETVENFHPREEYYAEAGGDYYGVNVLYSQGLVDATGFLTREGARTASIGWDSFLSDSHLSVPDTAIRIRRNMQFGLRVQSTVGYELAGMALNCWTELPAVEFDFKKYYCMDIEGQQNIA